MNCFQDITERKHEEEALKNSYGQLRALSARLQSVREEEATRIAREIHDDLGQKLTGLKMDLRRAERKLEGLESTPAANALLDTMVGATELTDKITVSVQEIAANLRPESSRSLQAIEPLWAVRIEGVGETELAGDGIKRVGRSSRPIGNR